MSAGWVAATVRAKAMARRRLGAGAARRLAAAPGLADALSMLAGTAYARAAAPGTTLVEAEQAVAAAEIWQLRVLSGWLPRSAIGLARALGARYELANIEAHARAVATPGHRQPYYELGSLAMSWPRIAATISVSELRAALVASPWGDPGQASAETLHDILVFRWLRMVAAEAPQATEWVSGAAVLVAAKQLLAAASGPGEGVVRAAVPLIGSDWVRTRSVPDLRAATPIPGRWVLDGVGGVAELWRAEAALAARIESDGFRLLRQGTPGVDPILGAVAVLAVDGWRVRVALGDAAYGAGPGEVLDVLDVMA
ncbi:hypothetical protein [Kribbella sp. HUAS MG21]|jgi:hypothetical protein|uniref:Uncharacterized protein n=1 Tax=Kribbella sp. HUAS MG21 TaxID=3160966 RepID=A0AAU7T8A2_9ACTN